jgi:hypothetical protein
MTRDPLFNTDRWSLCNLAFSYHCLEYHKKKYGSWRRGGTNFCGKFNFSLGAWGKVFSFEQFLSWSRPQHVSLACSSCGLWLPWTTPCTQSYSVISNKEFLHPVTIPGKINTPIVCTIDEGTLCRPVLTPIVTVPAQPWPTWPFRLLLPRGPHCKFFLAFT